MTAAVRLPSQDHASPPAPPVTLKVVRPEVHVSYNGSNVVFRVLRLSSWGPVLMNLGWFVIPCPLAVFNLSFNLSKTQRKLVMKSSELLGIQPGDEILDLACGRGMSSFIMHCMYPETRITGVDLLPENINVAKACFSQAENLAYRTGDAMNIDAPAESFDRVMCLEAAFHFPDRSRFLQEAFRVLRPGGKLVVVDFAWNTDADSARANDPETLVVRDIWQWENFYSISEYRRHATAAGFRVSAAHDWSHRVTRPLQGILNGISRLGNSSLGRALIQRINPLFQSITAEDWKELKVATRAHDYVQTHSKYMAFVFEKPTA